MGFERRSSCAMEGNMQKYIHMIHKNCVLSEVHERQLMVKFSL